MPVASPARARFRRIIAGLAAAGVLAFGIVPMSAAYAAPVPVTITMTSKVGTVPVVGDNYFFVNYEGATGSSVAWDHADPSGVLQYNLEPGSYEIYSAPGTRYASTRLPFTVTELGPNTFNLDIDTLPSVSGSVSPSLAGAVGINTYRWNGSYFGLDSVSPYAPDSNGNFEIWFSNPAETWALEFIPADNQPYMATWLGGAAEPPSNLSDSATFFTLNGNNTTTTVATTTLLEAGIVSGTVTGLGGDPIQGAYVIADDNDYNVLTETSTNGSGQYTLKVPLEEPFTVRSYESDWAHEYYNDARDADDAVVFILTDTDYVRTGIDFELFPYVEVDFDFFVLDGTDQVEYNVDFWLYRDSGSGYGPIPFEVDIDETSTGISELPPGEYRVGLQHTFDERWIPFDTVNTLPGDIDGDTGQCYYEFTVDGSVTEFAYELTAQPEQTNCTDAPWVDDAEDMGVVSGTVTNADDVVGSLTAQLYLYDDEHGDFYELVSGPVDEDGNFALEGVLLDGEYFVAISTPRNDPHISQFVGFGGQIALDEMYDIGVDGFDIDAQDDRNIGDIMLPQGRLFTGIVSAGGDPLEGMCVELETALTTQFVMCDQTDSAGRYYLKAPLPENELESPLGYRILTVSYVFVPTYYGADPLEGDVLLVETGGVDPIDRNIELQLLPTMISGYASVWNDSDGEIPVYNGIAHLYRSSGTTWIHVDEFELVHSATDSQFVFPPELEELFNSGPVGDEFDYDDLPGLTPADYRLWFEQDGDWLPIAESETIRIGPQGFGGYNDVESEACYVDVDDLRIGEVALVDPVQLDPDSDTDCTPPVLPPSTGGGGGGSGGPANPNPPRFVPPILDHDPFGEEPDEVVEPTPSPTPTPTQTPTPSPTPQPSADGDGGDGGLDLTWLWWGGGILLLIILAGGTTIILRRP